MPTYEKMEDWLQQSQLLLEARPTTTRITTKYSVNDLQMRKRAARAAKKAAADDASAAKPPTTTPRGSLVLKAYDPVSGATLKYRTTKAAEVSRLITSLGSKLGRPMAGLPALRDEPMTDAAATDEAGAGTPAADKADPLTAKAGASQPPPQAGGGKGKKKKGKK